MSKRRRAEDNTNQNIFWPIKGGYDFSNAGYPRSNNWEHTVYIPKGSFHHEQQILQAIKTHQERNKTTNSSEITKAMSMNLKQKFAGTSS